MEERITLHPEHGVNPMVTLCSVCGKGTGLALLGYNKGEEAPRAAVVPGEICDDCEHLRSLGIILIEARDDEEGPTPYRTGRLFVVTEDFYTRTFKGPAADDALKQRVCYVEERVIKAAGIDQLEPAMGDGPQLTEKPEGDA